MGAYTCPECVLSNGWHFDDSDPTQQPRAYRCPNRAMTEQLIAAQEYAEGDTTKAKQLARQVVEDAAYTRLTLDANTLEKEFDLAQVPEGLRPGAFTWAKGQGLIEKTNQRTMRVKKSTRHPVEIWRSLVFGKNRRAAS